MKPVGLTNPHNPTVKPWAIVQLRQDNALGTLFNMVGFQTKMKYGAQTDIFRMIPGLEEAQFARLGGIHRNTFLNSPKLLDSQLRLKSQPRLRFAGQLIGVEGYVESAAMGLLAGRYAAAMRHGRQLDAPPATTALGALIAHVTGGHLDGGKGSFQPMNVNFGLFPPSRLTTPRETASRARPRLRPARWRSAPVHWRIWPAGSATAKRNNGTSVSCALRLSAFKCPRGRGERCRVSVYLPRWPYLAS